MDWDWLTLARRFAVGTVLLAGYLCAAAEGAADLVTTSSVTGNQNRASQNNYVGLLDSVSPEQIGGLDVNFGNVPGGESFQIGDLVGRNLDDSGGGRTWEYLLLLPGNARAGTGLQNITFTGHAFERGNNNLEGDDQLTWQLFLNGSGIAADSGGPGAGIDFTSYDISLFDPGGTTITAARVVFSIAGFDASNEWMATRGTLSAEFTAIPERAPLVFPTLIGLVAGWWRCRRA